MSTNFLIWSRFTPLGFPYFPFAQILQAFRSFLISQLEEITNRKRAMSAPYLRLKNIRGTTIVKFFNYHTAPKKPERVFPETRKRLFDEIHQNWKYQKKTLHLEKIFFSKIIWRKTSHNAEEREIRPSGSINISINFK